MGDENKYRIEKYRKLMGRLAEIKSVQPILDVLETLNHLKISYLSGIISVERFKGGVRKFLKYIDLRKDD